MHGPENNSNHPGSPTDDPVLDTEDEPEDHTPVPKSPENPITISDETQLQIGNQILHITTP